MHVGLISRFDARLKFYRSAFYPVADWPFMIPGMLDLVTLPWSAVVAPSEDILTV